MPGMLRRLVKCFAFSYHDFLPIATNHPAMRHPLLRRAVLQPPALQLCFKGCTADPKK
jgi:hypothetical protein